MPRRRAIEYLFEHAHRLIEAHVLIDGEDFAGSLRLGRESLRGDEVQRQRLLRQDGLDVLLLKRMPDQLRLLIRRKGDVHDLDFGILDQRLRRSVDFGNSPAIRDRLGVGWRARRDCHHRKAGLFVARQMHVGHDEARADRADAKVAAPNGGIGDELGCV